MYNLAGFLKASFANKVEIKGPYFAAASCTKQIKSLAKSSVAELEPNCTKDLFYIYLLLNSIVHEQLLLFSFDGFYNKQSK